MLNNNKIFSIKYIYKWVKQVIKENIEKTWTNEQKQRNREARIHKYQ